MAVNNVVIGSLAKYSGVTVLRSENPGATIPFVPDSDFAITINLTPHTTNNDFNNYIAYETGDDRWGLRINTNGVFFRTYIGNIQDLAQTVGAPCVEGVSKSITLTRVDDLFTVDVDGVVFSGTSAVRDTASEVILARTVFPEFVFDVCNIDYNGVKYVQEGDFGSSVLPSTPSGSDGVLNDTYWWKKGVDQNFLTPQAYKSSWVIPMEESQDVIYTDGTPYYPEDDVFWNPYNQDLTYDFNVSQQTEGGGGIGVIGFNKLDINFSLTF